MISLGTRRIILIAVSAFAIIVAVIFIIVINRVWKKANEEKRRKIRQSQREEIYKIIKDDYDELEKIKKSSVNMTSDVPPATEQTFISRVIDIIPKPLNRSDISPIKIVEVKDSPKKVEKTIEKQIPKKKSKKCTKSLRKKRQIQNEQKIETHNSYETPENEAIESRSRSVSISSADINAIHELNMFQMHLGENINIPLFMSNNTVINQTDEEDDPRVVEIIDDEEEEEKSLSEEEDLSIMIDTLPSNIDLISNENINPEFSNLSQEIQERTLKCSGENVDLREIHQEIVKKTEQLE